MRRWPEFHPRDALRRLVAADVDFVVVGEVAAVVHGSVRVTATLDLCYGTDRPNLDALGRALVDLGAKRRGVDKELPFVADARTLRRVRIVALDTRAGPIDLLTEPAGASSYPGLRRRAGSLELDRGVVVAVAALEDLIAMKRASGRPKDLVDLEELEAIARLRDRIRALA